MAQVSGFPSIRPSGRAYQPPRVPMQTFATLSGYETRVRYGSRSVGAALSLSFQNLLEARINEVLGHYATAEGSMHFFSLPAEVAAGMNDSAAVVGARWRYADAPSVEWVAPGVASISCSLVSVFD